MPKPSGSNQENFERTRLKILEVSTAAFAERGFRGTSTTHICQQSGCSRGALYHQFENKEAIFKAVYDSLCQQIVEHIEAQPYADHPPIEGLLLGCTAYLKIFTDPQFAQVVIQDGPTVLGIEYCRSKDMETAYRSLYEGVAACNLPKSQVPLVTDFLSGALDTYALRIALAANRTKEFKRYNAAFETLARQVLG